MGINLVALFILLGCCPVALKPKYFFRFLEWDNLSTPVQRTFFKGYCEANDWKSPIPVPKPTYTRIRIIIEEVGKKIQRRERVIATLINLAIIGKTIGTVFTAGQAQAALGAAATISGVLIALYPGAKEKLQEVLGKDRKGPLLEVLVGKLAIDINHRLDNMKEYVETNTILYEKELIKREYTQMLLMYQNCAEEAKLEDDATRKKVFHDCLTDALRYIHSSFPKFALFHETLMTESSSLDTSQLQRLEANVFALWMYGALLHDCMDDWINSFDDGQSRRHEAYDVYYNEEYDKISDYLQLSRAEIVKGHAEDPKSQCQKSMECTKKSTHKISSEEFVEVSCSCIIDPLIYGDPRKCTVLMEGHEKQLSSVSDARKIFRQNSGIYSEDGKNLYVAIETYLKRFDGGLLEYASTYKNEFREQFTTYWEGTLAKSYQLTKGNTQN